MNPILPEQSAREECLKLIEELDRSVLGAALMREGHGRMFGVLVCTDGTVLRSFSGELEGELSADGFVPPLFDVTSYRPILYKYDRLIKSSQDHRNLSRKCWEELRDLYHFTCFDGSEIKLSSVLPDSPSGTGDCCAPRLLSHAYSQGKKPASLCEFFYGSGSMEHKSFHSPCDSRCRPLLPYIIGLDIIYQDSDIVVVNKPSGMLSIEGKGEDKQDCIASRVRSFFPTCISQPCIHRLDQATSGLMVLGLTKEAHDRLSRDFENRNVHKEYEALVDGLILEQSGTIELPIRLDVDNRPHQIVDFDNGKKAVTDWVRLSIENRYGGKVTRLRLIPHTGRTHQLRVHCASGLGHPILGDALYGHEPTKKVPRLMLQARNLSFRHPVTGMPMSFQLDADF
ncbi:MAG: RluA family pseudouridine synthase [Spirochaetales bacterium]|nr:RluA family pseudouridine synthase [Spirochaetales bacterium]